MVATAPSIATGIYKLADPRIPGKGSWAALTAWSSVLFVHGTTSFIAGLARKAPPPEKEQAKAARRPFTLVPILTGTRTPHAPGIAVAGVF
jgi:hypothetical protein